MSKARGNLGAAFPAGDSEYGANKKMLTVWDLTAANGKNDRYRKLGYGDTTHGAALLEFDQKTLRMSVADGIQKGTTVTSRRPFEPDNFVLRLHTLRGIAGDDVWALRMIVEHDNAADTKKHRSTMVIDQSKKQCWAFLMDALWIKALGAKVSDPELKFGGDGFLPLLQTGTSSGGSDKRAALAFNISKTGGYYTHGPDIAQLWHVLHLSKPRRTGFGGEVEFEDGPGQTVAESGGGGAGGTQAEGSGECKEPSRLEGTLRGDVNFDMEGDLVSIAIDKAYETGGEIYTGPHWIHRKLPKPPLRELLKDPKSNQPVLDRDTYKGLWCMVKLHANWQPPEVMPPPDAAATGPVGVGLGPAFGSGAGADAGQWAAPLPYFGLGQALQVYPAGKLTFIVFGCAIPELAGEVDCRIAIPFTLPVLLTAGEEMDFRLFHKKVLTPGDEIGSTWTETTVSLTEEDNPSSTTELNRLVFQLNRLGLNTKQGKGGGFIWFWFCRRSDDGVAKSFVAMEPMVRFKPSAAKLPPFAAQLETVA